MRDSTYSLYTFRGVKPRAQWDPRVLDDLEGDVESKNVGEVSIVGRDAVSAKKRCEEGRWVRLSHTATRRFCLGKSVLRHGNSWWRMLLLTRPGCP